MTGDTTHAVVAFTVPDASIFTAGKTIQANSMPGYPYDEILEGAALTVLSASGTTVTAEYDNAEFLIGSSDVSGATITQISHVNWSTDAGTLSCTSNCIPVTTLTTDSTQGNVTTVQPYTPYPSGGYTLTSTHQIHVTATAVDNPSSSITYTINQAANTTQVIIMGAQYTQAFEGQEKQLWAGILGNTDQRLTWSIATQPSGGDGTLSNTNKRNTVFSATVPGRYKVVATSAADGTKSSYEIIDVKGEAKPAWASAPADKVGPQACFQAPAMTGNLYEVGPTKTYTSFNAAMAQWIADGQPTESTIMLYNEDTTGSAPTTYAEYTQIPGLPTAGLSLNLCGIPDAQGHLPILTGENAHGPAWMTNGALYSLGLLLTYPTTGCYNLSDQDGSCGPTHIRIAGIKLENANPNYTFYKNDGSTAQWGGNGIDFRTGAHLSLEGIVCYQTSQCVGTYANENGGYASLSQSVLWQESYTSQNGIPNNFGSHPAYMQSINGNVIDRVYIDTPVSGDQGSCIKMRGQMTIIANSYCATGFARGIDYVEAQDDSSYIDFGQLLTEGGVYNQAGNTIDLNAEAARQETMFRDFAFGNLLLTGNNHYSHDHDDNQGNIGMNARYGNLYMWYNTLPNQSPIIDTHNQYNLNYFLDQKITLANNIIWNPTSWGINDFTMTLFEMQTNVMSSSTLNNTYPIWGMGFGQLGWNRTTQLNTIGFDRPLNPHLTGSFTTDYILTTTTPYDANYKPQSGSAAIGAATPVTGPMSDFAINYNAMQTPGIYSRRTDTTTIGAMDPIGGPRTGITLGKGSIFGKGVIR
jgi:hypothetical protein